MLKSFYGCRYFDEDDFKKPLLDFNKVRPGKDSGYENGGNENVDDPTYAEDAEDTTEDTTDTTQTTTPYKQPSSIVCVTSPCITTNYNFEL